MSSIAALDFVNAFCQAAEQVIREVLGETPERGQPLFQMGPSIALQAVNVSVGMTGDLGGHVNFGMDDQTACRVAAQMMCEDVHELDEMSVSALSELANMIAGNARTFLGQQGVNADITPPSVLRGAAISSSWANIRAMSQPLRCGAGVVHVTVGIRPKVQP